MSKTPKPLSLTVQETAEHTGLSVHTLRYYERAGLLDRVGRDDSSGHRRYGTEDIARIHFLRKMRATGMPISQLQRYVRLLHRGESTMEERRQMLERQREKVCAEITELSECLALLEYKIENYLCLEAEREKQKS